MNLADMNITDQALPDGDPVDMLYAELTQLQHRYGDTLAEEALTEPVKKLKDAIAQYKQGAPHAAEFLKNKGHELMDEIKSKLEAATAEQARLLDESPAAASEASGRHIHHTSRAAALAADAEAQLESTLEESTH